MIQFTRKVWAGAHHFLVDNYTSAMIIGGTAGVITLGLLVPQMTITLDAHAGTASSTTAGCPSTTPVVSCVKMPDTGKPVVGQQITDNPGATPGTPWMITDSAGDPMAWGNIDGLYSGGDGGAMPGGLLCVTYGTSATVACLTPTGDLQLRKASPHGPTGPTETLTPSDIAWLHKAEKVKPGW
jgi:hypothetical protein